MILFYILDSILNQLMIYQKYIKKVLIMLMIVLPEIADSSSIDVPDYNIS